MQRNYWFIFIFICFLNLVTCKEYNGYSFKLHKTKINPLKKVQPLNQLIGSNISLEFKDVLYNIQISIGVPEQIFNVQIDTGSQLLWIYDRSCEYIYTPRSSFTCNTCQTQNINNTCKNDNYKSIGYNNLESSTSIDRGGSCTKISYVGGDICSRAYKDKVKIGNIVIDNQLLFSTSRANEQFVGSYFSAFKTDGILGLGLNNNYKDISVMQNIDLSRNVIGIFLGYNCYNNPNLNCVDTSICSELIIGDVNINYINNNLHYFEIVGRYSNIINDATNNVIYAIGDVWKLSSSIYVNGKHLMSTSLIFDTGTTYCIFPDSLFNDILSNFNLPNPNNMYVNYALRSCAEFTNITDIFFYIHGYKYVFPKESFIFNNSVNCAFLFNTWNSYSPSNEILLGDIFLQNYYLIYDYDNYVIGLANLPNITTCMNYNQSAPSSYFYNDDYAKRLVLATVLAIFISCILISVLILFITFAITKDAIDNNKTKKYEKENNRLGYMHI